MRSIVLILLVLPFTVAGAEESVVKTFYPVITYACDKEADIVVVTNRVLSGEEGSNYKYSEQLGTYSPWDLVDIDNSSGRPRIRKKSNLEKNCVLSSGIYSVRLEPKPFGTYLDGRCGATMSAVITVTYDGIDILEPTPFEDYCHGNSPIITRVTTFGKTHEVKIKRIPKYKFY